MPSYLGLRYVGTMLVRSALVILLMAIGTSLPVPKFFLWWAMSLWMIGETLLFIDEVALRLRQRFGSPHAPLETCLKER